MTARGMLVALVAAVVAGAALAEPTAPIATMTPAGTSVMWVVDAGTENTVLTVSGQSVEIRRKNVRGTSPMLSLLQPDGSSLPDGTYTWELRESFAGLNDGVHDPENGRIAADPATAPARVEVEGKVQSGSFTVKNGLVIDSTLAEPTADGDGSGKEAN
jgi:hypothetical protein